MFIIIFSVQSISVIGPL